MSRLIRRLLLALAVLALLVALTVGHIWFWYLPRARAARPEPGSAVAGLLMDTRYPAALWVPYPHQNLGALDPTAEDHRGFLAALARLSGLPPPVLPSFGGFPVVPASELALAADESGERFVVMAQVYPGLALFSRLAGRLAENPWLAGGAVVINDQAADVRWDGNVWIVESVATSMTQSSSVPARLPTSGPFDGEASLGLLAVHRAVEPFPADLYRLEGDATRIRVSSQAPFPTPLWERAQALRQEDLVLLLMAGPVSVNGVQSLAFFRRPASSDDLPRAATLVRQDPEPEDRWRVPGASLARLAGALRRDTVGDWQLRAIGDGGLASARTLVPAVARVAGDRAGMDAKASLDGATPPGAAANGILSWGLWADLSNTHAEVARLARLAEEIPLIPRREARRWQDAETVLAPVAAHFDTLVLTVAGTPAAVRLELIRRDTASADATSAQPPGDRD